MRWLGMHLYNKIEKNFGNIQNGNYSWPRLCFVIKILLLLKKLFSHLEMDFLSNSRKKICLHKIFEIALAIHTALTIIVFWLMYTLFFFRWNIQLTYPFSLSHTWWLIITFVLIIATNATIIRCFLIIKKITWIFWKKNNIRIH